MGSANPQGKGRFRCRSISTQRDRQEFWQMAVVRINKHNSQTLTEHGTNNTTYFTGFLFHNDRRHTTLGSTIFHRSSSVLSSGVWLSSEDTLTRLIRTWLRLWILFATFGLPFVGPVESESCQRCLVNWLIGHCDVMHNTEMST